MMLRLRSVFSVICTPVLRNRTINQFRFSNNYCCCSTALIHSSTSTYSQVHQQKQAQTTGSNVERKLYKYGVDPEQLKSVNTSGQEGRQEQDDGKPVVIYNGALSGQLKRLKLFSMSTSGMGLFLQPLLLSKLNEVGYGPVIVGFTVLGMFTYGTPFLIHLLARRYVTEIIYNPITDKYTAATYSFFLRRKEMEFGVDDIIIPEIPGPLTSFLIKSSKKPGKTIPIFTMDTCFSHLEHYGRFMKFDQPMDLHLGSSDTSDSTHNK